MKNKILLLLAVGVLFCLIYGCAPATKPVEYDLAALSAEVSESGAFSDLLSPVQVDIAASIYSFDTKDVTECSLLCSTGATTEEIGLFKCVDDAAATRVKATADARVKSQRTAYESYAPDEMPKLDEAIVSQNGLYVFYIVSKDSAKVDAILKAK
ncbi:MAG: DUF4358 domain-containing protein, partial [Oscillospiraceae bacterium]